MHFKFKILFVNFPFSYRMRYRYKEANIAKKEISKKYWSGYKPNPVRIRDRVYWKDWTISD